MTAAPPLGAPALAAVRSSKGGDRRLLGLGLILASTLIFAFGPTAAKLALEDGSNALTVVAARGIIGTLLMGALVLATGTGFRIGARTLALCVGAGLSFACMSYGFIGAVATIPVSLAIVIFAANPILVAAMWHVTGQERLTRRRLLLGLAALLGIGLALGEGVEGLEPAGVALAVLATVAVCGFIHFTTRAQEGAGSLQVNLWLTLVTAAVFLPTITALDAWALPAGALGWFGLIAAGVGVSVGLLAFLAAIRIIGAVRATMASNLEPLFGTLLAVLLLGERLDAWQWGGVLLVVGALLLFEAPEARSCQVGPRQVGPRG